MSAPSFSLSGKVIIQSGGSGLLGRALVSGLAASGATLMVASRDAAKLETQAAAERAAGRQVFAEPVDIGSEASIHALRDRVLAAHGRIDGLVFNAVSRPMRKMDDDLAAWKASMDTNATGFFAMVRGIGDAIAKTGGGSIVNIASMMGMIGMNPWLYEGTAMGAPPDYFFHKGGMINLTRYYAALFGPHSVRVNCLSPGGFFNNQPEPFLSRYKSRTFLGRMADDTDLGGPVIFLLSEAARYVTGTNLPVDGGYTAK